MTEPLSFSPFLGWTDVTDPNNIPTDAKPINAADLLRYEQFNTQVAVRLNQVTETVENTNVLDEETGLVRPELLPTIIDGGTP